jgi:general secretion pathway protein D
LLLLFPAICMLALASTARAQTPTPDTPRPEESGIPIERLTALVAKKTSKHFVLDPRVHGGVILIGEDPSEVNYSEFLTILAVYGFSASEDGKLVQIVPDANSRQLPTALITDKDTRPSYEFVTEVFTVKRVSAAQLIPILRPMLPQYAHLAAYPESNVLVISDHYANVRRMQAIIREIDATGVVTPRATRADAAAPDSGGAH